jgi:hypothetical protein
MMSGMHASFSSLVATVTNALGIVWALCTSAIVASASFACPSPYALSLLVGVVLSMVALRNNRKIFRAVVQLITIDMVDLFVRCQCAAQRFRHNQSMFLHVSLRGFNEPIPCLNVCSSAPRAVARARKHGQITAGSRAKVSRANLARGTFDGFPAMLTL